MCYWSCVKEHTLPTLYAPVNVQKLQKRQSGLECTEKSSEMFLKLGINIPKHSKTLTRISHLYIQGKLGEPLVEVQHKALHFNSPGISEQRGSQ